MAHVLRTPAGSTRDTALTVPAVLNTETASAQGNGATAATSTASAVLVLRSVISDHVSRETAHVHRQSFFRCRGRLVLHRMVAVVAQTITLAVYFMGAVATRMDDVESFRRIVVQDGKYTLASPSTCLTCFHELRLVS